MEYGDLKRGIAGTRSRKVDDAFNIGSSGKLVGKNIA